MKTSTAAYDTRLVTAALAACLAAAATPSRADDSAQPEAGTEGGQDEPEEAAEETVEEGDAEPAGQTGPEEETGELLIPVSEKGATVVVDGEEVGESPLPALGGLPGGTYEIRVDKEGFYTHTAEVDVPAGGSVRHDVLLDEGGSGKVEMPAFMKTWWFWTVVGAVVVTGATVGIYYGVQEDEPDAVPLPPY
jgi:hypothetical protein